MIFTKGILQLFVWILALNVTATDAAEPKDELSRILAVWKSHNTTLQSVAFSSTGGYSMVSRDGRIFNRNIPMAMHEEMLKLTKAGKLIKSVAFGPSDEWVVLYGDYGFSVNSEMSVRLRAQLHQLAWSKLEIKQIAFAPEKGWTIVYGKGDFTTHQVDPHLEDEMQYWASRGLGINSVIFSPFDGGWIVLTSKGYGAYNLPQNIPDRVLGPDHGQVQVALAPEGSACVWNESQVFWPLVSPDLADEFIQKLLGPAKTPGAGAAVIQNGKIKTLRSFGVKRAGFDVTSSTQFQAASISKSVTSFGVLQLVERGIVSLDQDVDAILEDWHLPPNPYTKTDPVTMRRLLSHTAGMSVHGFGGYRVDQPLPTLIQILNGKNPANSPSIRVVLMPGTKYKYSGGGYCVLQELMVEKNRSYSFANQMHDLVLTKANMSQSTYEQPLPNNWQQNAATGYSRGKAIRGNWHVYPEQAPAGLWTTPHDLAKFIIEVQRSFAGDPNSILKQDTAIDMLSSQPASPYYGLGVGISGEKDGVFSHGGANEGFRCSYVARKMPGDGLVVMTNSNEGSLFVSLATRLLCLAYGLDVC